MVYIKVGTDDIELSLNSSDRISFIKFCSIFLLRWSLRKTHETMLNQTRSNVEGVKLSETLIWWNLITERTPAIQAENVKSSMLKKGEDFNPLFPAGINFSFLLFFGLTFRFELFYVCFDILKTLSNK